MSSGNQSYSHTTSSTLAEEIHNWARSQKNIKQLASDLYPHLSLDSSYARFMDETDKNRDRAKFGLLDAVKAAKLSGDPSLFIRIMWELGYSVVPRERAKTIDDLRDAAMSTAKETGDFIGAVHEAVQDGKISWYEISILEKECREAKQALCDALQRAKDMADRT